ncbi:MAG TPA: sugar transferase [Terriglobia bacterium]|nr:sugar transferase [Terriglobia bacterium]
MKGNLPKYLLLFADLAAIVIAFRVAYFLRYDAMIITPISKLPDIPFSAYSYAVFLALGTWILIFLVYGVDHFPGSGESALAVSKLITASVFLIASLLAGMYLAQAFYSRLLFLFLSVLVVLFLFATRLIYQAAFRHLRKRGMGLRRVVIVGHSELAAELGDRIERHLDLHYDLVGYLSPTAGRIQSNGFSGSAADESTLSSMSGSEAMAAELAKRNVHELLFAIPIRRETETLEFIAHCQQRGIAIKSVPEYYDLHTSHIVNLRIDGIPILEMKETSLHPSHQFLKRIIDLVLVLLTLPLTLPVLALVSAALYLGSRRVFRGERRVGLGGRPFRLYRFDLRPYEDEELPPSNHWKARFARFLVRYSISELPQVWNVLKGDMSFVGPQAESPERARHYSAWHRRRLQLKPGITGLAQVQGLRQVDSSDLKTKYDLEYAANYTPLVDLALVLATISTLLSRRKAQTHHQGPPGGFRPVSSDPLNISGN